MSVINKKNLFLEYVCEKFGERLHKAILRFLLQHKGQIENRLPNNYTLTYFDMEDIDYKMVRIDSKEGNRIDFDIIAVPELDCSIKNIRNKDYDRELVNDLWLTISCSGDISIGLKNFHIADISEYVQVKQQKPLADDLVPIIAKSEYEKYAKEILEKFYPECLEGSQEINAEILAQRMGLRVIKRTITEDGDIFGQIYFQDTEVELYDRKNKRKEKCLIPSNTIIVDSDATSFFSYGSLNITIAHECVHFYLHRKAFYFVQMLDSDLLYIQCQSNGEIKGIQHEEQNNWMEIQANGIAPYLLMPKEKFLKQYQEYDAVLAILYNRKKAEYFEELIRKLADQFKVSIYAARKRLIDLGVNAANGVLNWVDNHYVKPYFFKDGVLAPNETFTASAKDIYNRLFTIGNVAGLIYQGDFVFVENHLCINSSKFIEKDEGEDHLTEYARYHMEECCLKFKLKTKNNIINNSNLETFCYLCRDFIKDINFDVEISTENTDLLNSRDLPSRFEDYRKTISEIKQTISFKKLSEILKYFVDNLQLDVKCLAIDTGLDERTIRRYLSGENKVPDKRSVIAICMAMNLPPEIVEIVLRQSHIALAYGNEDDDALLSVISMMRGKSITKINKYLQGIGAEPLTNKIAL